MASDRSIIKERKRTEEPPQVFDHAYTHNGDAELLESLGLLTTWPASKSGTSLGEVSENGWKIAVSVSSHPAMFWSFDIYPNEDVTPVRLETGSGGFVDYWHTAKQFAENMLVIERL